ncbi:hypothetical protein [Aurantivibrio infirmus]
MKNDVLTIAVIVFVVGVVVSTVSFSNVFDQEEQAVPTALHRGVIVSER